MDELDDSLIHYDVSANWTHVDRYGQEQCLLRAFDEDGNIYLHCVTMDVNAFPLRSDVEAEGARRLIKFVNQQVESRHKLW